MDIKLELFAGVIADAICDNIEYMNINTEEINSRACLILAEIQRAIQSEEIEDDFYVVEEIVRIFEKHHIDAGCRHDF